MVCRIVYSEYVNSKKEDKIEDQIKMKLSSHFTQDSKVYLGELIYGIPP